jgi:hypothetical protein
MLFIIKNLLELFKRNNSVLPLVVSAYDFLNNFVRNYLPQFLESEPHVLSCDEPAVVCVEDVEYGKQLGVSQKVLDVQSGA